MVQPRIVEEPDYVRGGFAVQTGAQPAFAEDVADHIGCALAALLAVGVKTY